MNETQKTVDLIDDETYRLIEDMLYAGKGTGDVVDVLVEAGFYQSDALDMTNAVRADLDDAKPFED